MTRYDRQNVFKIGDKVKLKQNACGWTVDRDKIGNIKFFNEKMLLKPQDLYGARKEQIGKIISINTGYVMSPNINIVRISLIETGYTQLVAENILEVIG